MAETALNILLVEDNDDHAELVMRSLSRLDGVDRIVHVSDGAQAIEYLFREGEYSNRIYEPLPNLILLDLRLPKVDGLTVLKTIKESDKLSIIPTVVFTSSEAEKDINLAYKYHANSFVVKPLDAARFKTLMQEIENYWRQLNTNPMNAQGRSGN